MYKTFTTENPGIIPAKLNYRISKLLFAISVLTLGNGVLHAQNFIPVKQETIHSSAIFRLEKLVENNPKLQKHLESLYASKNNSTLNSASVIVTFDSIYNWTWGSAMWNYQEKQVNIIYDVNNNLTSYVKEIWDGISWVYSDKFTQTFDVNNNITVILRQAWNVNVWENAEQTVNTYDVNNNLTSSTFTTWNGVAFENSSLTTYTFDVNNNQTSATSQLWNVNTWDNNILIVSSYDLSNNLTHNTLQNWNGTAWVNFYQVDFTYDINNNQITSTDQIWNGSSWENSSQITNTYDVNNNQIGSISNSWSGTAWDNSNRTTNTFDVNNKLINSTTNSWDGIAWVLFSKNFYTYDIASILLSQTNLSYDALGGIDSGDSTYFYFNGNVGVKNIASENVNLIVTPNPFNGMLTVLLKGGSFSYGEIRIFNLSGQEVLRKEISELESKINTEEMTPGIYLLSFTEGNRSIQGKIVKY